MEECEEESLGDEGGGVRGVSDDEEEGEHSEQRYSRRCVGRRRCAEA